MSGCFKIWGAVVREAKAIAAFYFLIFILLKRIFFDVDYLNLLQYCFCFKFWFCRYKACGILAP